jgi:hypothetical protein
MNVFDSTATPTPTTSATSTATPIVSPTPTLSGQYVSTSINPHEINIGESALVTVSLNNVPTEGYNSAEFTCTYNANLFEVSNITITSLFGADAASVTNGPQDHSFIVAIAGSNGNKATTSGAAFTFNVKGLQTGQTVIECRARVSQGNNALTEIPFAVDYLTILGSTPTPNITPSSTPVPSSTSEVPVATTTSSPTPTPPANDWLTFTNATFGFEFRYPFESQVVAGGNDNWTRINLPRVAGTNLGEKYLEMIARENTGTCQSPLASSSGLETSETVVINGITFLKETGGDGSAGHTNKWTAYSTSRENACVSLDFVLRAANPGNFATPIPTYDEAAESAAFGQIVGTYAWLALPPTSTPTFTFTPTVTSTFTSTPSSTPAPTLSATVTGQVLASKPVTINLYNADNSVATSITANVDGTFRLLAPAGTYSLVATASGFLSAQASITLTAGSTITMPVISLPAGDIDDNNVINQFDVLTLGMSYNTSTPPAADLNNDGIINVLDLELLAKNYLKSGALIWE